MTWLDFLDFRQTGIDKIPLEEHVDVEKHELLPTSSGSFRGVWSDFQAYHKPFEVLEHPSHCLPSGKRTLLCLLSGCHQLRFTIRCATCLIYL